MAGTEELPPEGVRELYPFLYAGRPATSAAHPGTAHAGTAHPGTAHSGTAHSGTAHSGTAHSGTAHPSDSVTDDTVPTETVPPEAVPPEAVPPEAVPPDSASPDAVPSGTAALLDSVLSEVSRSTTEKATEIVRLRAEIAARLTGQLVTCAEAMAARFTAGGRLFAFGNGGSSTDAEEVAAAFSYPAGGRPLPALCLTSDVAVITALSNDVGFDVVFARQLAALGRAGDIALGLSTSGGSANVVRGLEEAGRRGMLTVALAGYDGGQLAELAGLDHLFVIPSASVHRIQEAQTTVYHVLWELIQHALGAIPIGGAS
jgi:D-sedoheptulose 7-phosphate isomerase